MSRELFCSLPYVGPEQSRRLGETALALHEKHWAEWRARSGDPPSKLYHYTNPEGLLGILDSGRLWATDAFYLNDSSELRYAVKLIRTEISKRIQGVGPILQHVYEQVKTQLSALDMTWGIFAACFCQKGDLLSQWRAYGMEGGYAIGFDVQTLSRERAPDVRLRRVIYDQAMQASLLVELLGSLDEFLKKALPEDIKDASLSMFVMNELVESLVAFKNPAFAQEEEWRAVVRRGFLGGTENLSFRAHHRAPIPYYPLDLNAADGKSPIDEIVIGPTTDPELARRSMLALSSTKHLQQVLIRFSEIPLRD